MDGLAILAIVGCFVFLASFFTHLKLLRKKGS